MGLAGRTLVNHVQLKPCLLVANLCRIFEKACNLRISVPSLRRPAAMAVVHMFHQIWPDHSIQRGLRTTHTPSRIASSFRRGSRDSVAQGTVPHFSGHPPSPEWYGRLPGPFIPASLICNKSASLRNGSSHCLACDDARTRDPGSRGEHAGR